jgi:MFS family permease
MSYLLPCQPIILNGLIGSSLSTILLGLSTSLPMLIAARSLSGALNGNVAIFKSVIGESTDRSNAARAFGLLPLVWATGCTIGPLLGGS